MYYNDDHIVMTVLPSKPMRDDVNVARGMWHDGASTRYDGASTGYDGASTWYDGASTWYDGASTC